jgi:bifunctional non-homologous end joining protein LigD
VAKAKTTLDIAGVRFTSPDRLVWPDAQVSKLQLAEYYLSVAARMLPHLSSRPVTMIRCPDNFHQCFFQKHIDEAAHYEGVTGVWLNEGRGRKLYASVDNPRGLIALVQLGVVEFHTPGVRSDNLGRPDRFILDLDPDPSVGWDDVVHAARALRELLQELGLVSFVKTTGGKGLHVVVPIRRTQTVEAVHGFSQKLAQLFEAAAPKRYTTTVAKAKRKGKILLDYLRNAPGATAVEAYAARARAGAPVAVPVDWAELDEITGDRFTIRTIKDRLASLRADPWQDFFETRQSITATMLRRVGL